MTNSARLGYLRTVAKGAGLHFLGRGFDRGAVFVFNLVLANLLVASAYGTYTYAATIVTLVAVLTRHGAAKTLLRLLPASHADRSRQDRVISIATASVMAVSTIGATVLFFLAPTISRLTLDTVLFTGVLRIFAVAVPIKALLELLNNGFLAQEAMVYKVAMNDIFEPVSRILFVGGAVGLGYTLLDATLATVVSLGGTFVVSIFLFIRWTPIGLSRDFDWPTVRDFYDVSLPLGISDASRLLADRADLLLVGLFLHGTAVGVYNVSILVAGLLVLPGAAFAALFRPLASRLYADGELGEVRFLYSVVTRWTVTVGLFVVAAMVIYRRELLGLFGPEYTVGGPLLILLVVGQFSRLAVGPTSALLYLTENQRIRMLIDLTFGSATAILAYVLIGVVGLWGAAAATATTSIGASLVGLLMLARNESIYPYTTATLKPVIAVLPAAGVMITLRPLSVVLGGLLGGVIMAIGLVLLGLEFEDLEVLSSLYEDAFNRS